MLKRDHKKSIISRIAILCVLFLVFIRLYVYRNYLLGWNVFFSSDNAVYAILAQRFLNRDIMGAIHPYWNPGFPLATAIVYPFLGSWEKAQLLVSIISGTLLIGVMFWLLKSYSLSLALIAAFITAFSGGLQKLVIVEGITEPLYILMLFLGIAFGWLMMTTSKIHYSVFAGIFFALAYLTRTDSVGIFVAFLLFSALYIFFDNLKKGWKGAVGVIFHKLGKLIIVFVLINAPYVAVNSIHLGKLTFSGKYSNMVTGPIYALEKDRPSTLAQDVFSVDYPDYQSPYYNVKLFTKRLIVVLVNGSFFDNGKKVLKESLVLYRSENSVNFFTGKWLGLAIFGLFWGLLIRKFRIFTFYLLLLFLAGLAWNSFFMSPVFRYLVFAYLFFFYLQALAVYIPGKVLYDLFFIRGKKVLAVLASGAIVFFLMKDYFVKNFDILGFTSIPVMSRHQEYKELGNWVRSQAIEVISAHFEAIGFYGNAKTVYMPSEKPDKIVKYLQDWGVEYLIIRPDEIDPYFQEIASPNYKNPNLELVKAINNYTLIWRVKLTPYQRINNRRIMLRNY